MSEDPVVPVSSELDRGTHSEAAASPFNKSTADVILRTSDGVDFKVHRLILSEASSFFETMFSLPQTTDGLLVISVVQDRQVMDNLLRFCYPVANPRITKLSALLELVAAAHSYQMESIEEGLREMILIPSLLSQDPMRVYALACGSKWKKGAKAAAQAMVAASDSAGIANTILPYHPAMEDITGGDLQRLLSYFQRCGKAARALTEPHNMQWLPAGFPWFGKKKCSYCSNTESSLYNCKGMSYSYARTWWMDYMDQAGAQLEKRPCKDTLLSGSSMDGSWAPEMMRCECGPEVRKLFNLARGLFAKAVDEAVSEVELVI